MLHIQLLKHLIGNQYHVFYPIVSAVHKNSEQVIFVNQVYKGNSRI